jgi:hypothetical protein
VAFVAQFGMHADDDDDDYHHRDDGRDATRIEIVDSYIALRYSGYMRTSR